MTKRVIALILSVVMVLGMMPMNITASAEELLAEDISVGETVAPVEEETVPATTEQEESVKEVLGTIVEETAPVYMASATGAGTCGATMFWSVDENGLLSIWGRGAMDDYSFTAASYAPWYEYRSYVKTVSISDTVTSIGNQAFNSCYNLTSIVIPASVTDVGERAFVGCSKLKTITFEGDAPSLTYYAFYDISAIVYFPANNSTWTEEVLLSYGGRIAWVCSGEDSVIARGTYGAYGTDDIAWTLYNDGTLEFVGTGAMYQTNQTPSWNSFDSQIKKVVVNSGITSVCDDAFARCSNLTEVSLPETLTYIGDSAFASCTGLTSIVVPKGVTWIGEGAFANCAKLTDISLPDTLTSIGNDAFSYCVSLTEISLPESLTEIEYGAFGNCTALKKVAIPKGVTYIDSYIVRECSNLETFELWYTVDLIDYDAFWNCPALNRIIFHGTQKQWNAVEKDSSVVSVLNSQNVYIQYVDPCVDGHTEVIDKGIAATCTTAGKTEGKHCSVCSKVLVAQQTIPAGHDLVGGVCQRCGIISGTCGNNLTWTLTEDGVLTISGTGAMDNYSYNSIPWHDYRASVKAVVIEEGITSIGDSAFHNCSSLGSVTIPDSVVRIGEYAFTNCSGLTEIAIPDNVSSIGSFSFQSCTGMTSVTIGDSVASIDSYAFSICSALTSVDLPDAVTSIGENAFWDCAGLTSIRIPASVTNIGMGAFSECDNLAEILVDEANTNYSSDQYGVLFNKDKTELIQCPSAKSGQYVIPVSVNRIGASAFARCANLTYVEIPDSVSSIGASAFAWCENLDGIVIPKTVTSIESFTFSGCYSLTSIVIPKAVISIGNFAFQGDGKLKSITFEGDAPEFTGSTSIFRFVYATAYYPSGNDTWTAAVRQNYGGTITWEAYEPHICSYTAVVTPPNCTEQGYTTYTCSGCGDSYIEDYVDAQHTEVIDEAVEASCTTDGKTEGKHCSACGEVLVAQQVIPAGHTVENGVCTRCKRYGTCGDNLTWTLTEDGVLTISGTGAMRDFGHGKAPWYAYADAIKKIVINAGVTTIGADAFYELDEITALSIPEGVTSIGKYSICACDNLIEIELPESLTTIGEQGIRNCHSLKSIYIPAKTQNIHYSNFGVCGNLDAVVVDPANSNYCSINGLLYDKNVQTLIRCPGGYIGEIVIPDGVTKIEQDAFWGNQKITKVTFPKTVTQVGKSAFSNCSGLQSVAFYGDKITFGDTVFWSCGNMTSVVFTGFAPKFGNDCFLNDTTTVYYPANDLSWNSVILKNYGGNVKWVASGTTGYIARGTCGANLTWELTDDGVLTVSGTGAMDACYPTPWEAYIPQIKKAVIEEGVTTLGSGSFNWCSEMEAIDLPESLTAIDGEVFFGCSGLKEIHIPQNVSVIDADGRTFAECTALTGIWVDEANTTFTSDENGVLFNKNKTTLIAVPKTITGEFVIPESVTSIAYGAFWSCATTTAVKFVADAPTINSQAFVDMTATVSYPAGNKTWTEAVRQNYGGSITWVSYGTGPAVIASGTCGANLTWVLTDDGVLTVSGTGAMANYAAASDAPWYTKRIIIKKIVIENGITTIGDRAFDSYAAPTEVSIGDTVTSIGANAFFGCSSLTSIVIPGSVTSIGDWTFANCSSLTEIVIPESVTSINAYAFYGCSSLAQITIHDSVTGMGKYAFCKCSSLTSIVIPDSVTKIDDYAFQNCSNLKEIYFCGDAPSLESSSFIFVDATAYYPAGNETWTEEVRKNYGGTITWVAACTNGHTEVIDEAVEATCTTDGKTEGKHCSACGEVLVAQQMIPAGHTVENGICTRCEAYGTCGDNLTWTLTEDGVLIISGKGAMDDYMIYSNEAPWCEYKSSVKTVILEDGVTSIGNFAFNNHDDLTGVTIPDSVTVMGDHAFINCDGLTNVEIPDSVAEIKNAVFFDCDGLTKMEIPDSVTRIGVDAFYHCSNLTEVVIPDSVTYIGSSAFGACKSMESITIPFVGASPKTAADSNQYPFGYIFGNMSYDGSEATNQFYYEYPAADSRTNQVYYIPTSLKTVTVTGGEILLGAFSNCTGLTTIVLPNDITNIGEQAFDSCSSLKTINIPATVTDIGEAAFRDCVNLKTVAMPEGLKTVAEDTFSGCSSLTKIVIPESVSTIGEYAFYCCTDLTEVTIGNGVTDIDYRAFYGCEKLAAVNFGIGVVSIGEAAFENCGGLAAITLPDSLENIGSYAFFGCSSLTDIVIPEKVSSIGDFAFRDCKGITEIRFVGDAPVIATYGFDCVTITAYYPAGNETWTQDVMQNYSGTITWKPYCVGEHTEVIDEAVEATCTADGKTEGKHCSACGEVLVEQVIVPAKGHSLVEVPAAEPTFEAAGNIAHFHCEGCGKLFADAEGETELNPEDVVLEKLSGGAVINGKVYETVAEALADAKAGDTVKLLQDTVETEVRVGEGITLDLNGNVLQAEYLFAVNGSQIADNSEGNTGLLKVDADKVVLSKTNSQLPVWNGEGFLLVDILNFQQMHTTGTMGQKQFIFSPTFETIVHQYLALGKTSSHVRMAICMTWKTGTGSASQNFVFNDRTVKAVVESFNGSWYTQAFYVTVANGGFTDFDVRVFLISDTGVELACN